MNAKSLLVAKTRSGVPCHEVISQVNVRERSYVPGCA
jgi:hypothetical protein